MLYAASESGEKIFPVKQGRAFCPFCRSIAIAKCGEIYAHHWAHETNKECDEWYESESDWHLNWKSMFSKEYVEVTIQKNRQRHRADIVGHNGTVIELQHSPISITVISERELFYENMIWLFDMAHKRQAFTRKSHKGEIEFPFKWSHPKLSLLTCKKPIYFDFGTKKSSV
jgi:competence CoiA-like predicted nuclease